MDYWLIAACLYFAMSIKVAPMYFKICLVINKLEDHNSADRICTWVVGIFCVLFWPFAVYRFWRKNK